jgi:hypothetical protein
MEGYKITRNDTGRPVREGDALKVDDNLPVTFVAIESPPWGDDETGEWHPGQVRVRYSWGAVEPVSEARAGVTISET